MRTLLAVCVLALPAFGHIKLASPGNFQATGTYGDPNKDEPCGGSGVATGVITEVLAGSQLTVRWTEPIPHPGYFRIGIARSEADFVTPTPVLTNGGRNCASAPIQSPVAYPTLVDGLFPHTSTQGPYQTTVTVPMMSCANCTLQVMQFMSAHAPSCFYFQCAKLRIVMPDAGQPMVDAGVDAGTSVDAGVDAGTGAGGGGGSTAAGGGSGGSGGTTCGAASCTGCCVLDRCEPGTTEAACGAGGTSCNACSGGTTCESGMCQAAPVGCGCTSAPVGLLAFALGLWALRRSRRSEPS